ncbi:MAG: M43 family zinc metalloprotease [Ferruginibacter sp.]
MSSLQQLPVLGTAPGTSTDSTSILTIPVVIHVLHYGEQEGDMGNVTSSQLTEMISYMNKAFAAEWPGYPDSTTGGQNTRIRFELAKRTPTCRPTNGIVRFDASGYPGYKNNGGLTDDLLQKTTWDFNRYFNILIVEKIGYLPVSGYAMPMGATGNFQGMVIQYFYAKKGNALPVHEAGHYLGLPHTFGSSQGDECDNSYLQCLPFSTRICDADPHPKNTACGDTNKINPCTGRPFGNIVKNFMSYSDLFCTDRFTRQQNSFMREWALSRMPAVTQHNVIFDSLPHTTIRVRNDTLYCNNSGTTEWYKNGVLTATTSNGYFIPVEAGSYHAVARINNCYGWPSDTVNVYKTGLLTRENIQLFPNPSDGNFKIVFKGMLLKGALLQVMDASGRILLATQLPHGTTAIDVALKGKATGLLFIYIKDNSGSIVQKMLVL